MANTPVPVRSVQTGATPARGYAAKTARAALAPFSFTRRAVGPNDVSIEILYCGICHSDIHQVRDEWGGAIFPMVPGHEIAGRVTAVGEKVTKFRVGDLAGVGCLVDSCRRCPSCAEGLEQYCENGNCLTYNALGKDGQPTYGGYSDHIVVDERFTLKITHPESQLAAVAPLLCAGITTYSPLRHWGVGPGKKAGIVGLGGLGHMGLKIAHALGAETVLFTHSPKKIEDAKRMGADQVVITTDEAQMKAHHRSFDFLLDTASGTHNLNEMVGMLKRDATLVLVGAPERPHEVNVFPLLGGRRSLAGSNIGGLPETQEMLDFCAQHELVSDVEVIPIQKVNEAYERVVRSDVRYRFTIDMASLKQG